MKKIKMIDKILEHKWIYHIGFWALSLLILYKVFTKDYQNGTADVVYTILFHIPLLILVYSNRFLLSKWMLGKKYSYYFLSMLIMFGLSLGMHFLIFEFLSNYIFPGFYFISYYSVWSIIQFLLIYWVISSLILLSVNWFELKDRQVKLEKESSKVRLDALKSQLNPHFLFNSLNNIYSLASSQETVVRNYLVKLSDTLRYMLYETNEDFVLLENEIRYLQDYLDLEKLRLNYPERVNFLVAGSPSGHLIAPLILLPLVENCFKHINKMNPEIKINLSISDEGLLMFSANNTFGNSDEVGGVGLNNLKRRLHLIYPKKHQFEVSDREGVFNSKLQLDLSL